MSISLVLTTAGIAAIVNARNTGTSSVEIVQVGLTETAFAPAPGTAAIPAEFARLSTISGDVVADDTVHLVVRDEGAGSYSLRGIGLYLTGGVLFATYSQATAIVQKTPGSIMLLALDIKLAAGDAATITFGDTDFLNPPATTDRQGVVELATAAEALAGLDPSRAITPATLKPLLDALLKLAGGQTVAGNVGFGGAPPTRPVTAQGSMVVRNPAAQADYRNWEVLAYGAAKGALALRVFNDADTTASLNVFTVDGATGALDFNVQPKVGGNGIWHAGNLAVDQAATPLAVAQRNNAGHLRASWFYPAVGAGLFNAAGYYFYSGFDNDVCWFARSAHVTDAALMLQRKDGAQLGGLFGSGDTVGFLNKNGLTRFVTYPGGDAYVTSDLGISGQVLTSNRLPVNTTLSSLDGSSRLRFTAGGRSTYYTPEAHEFAGGPTYFQSASGVNGFEAGTGDGATYATYNLALKLWNGLALRSFDGAVNLVVSARTGDLTTKGIVSAASGAFGGAPPVRALTANSEFVLRNPGAIANYRNWDWIATGGGKGGLYLRMLNDAGDTTTFDVLSVDGQNGGVNFAVQPLVAGNSIWHGGNFDPASKAPVIHSHDWAQVTGKPTSFPPSAHGHAWTEITGKPGSFPPDVHTHDLSGLTGSIKSLGSSGYEKIGDLIFQWAVVGPYTGDTTGNWSVFPITFPSVCLGVVPVATVNSGINSGASRYGWSVTSWDATGFSLINDCAASAFVYWAWGY